MSLVGEQCKECQQAVNRADGGGLAGSWWRGWANVGININLYNPILAFSQYSFLQANANSGYIGAGIVATFLVLVAGWYLFRWIFKFRTLP